MPETLQTEQQKGVTPSTWRQLQLNVFTTHESGIGVGIMGWVQALFSFVGLRGQSVWHQEVAQLAAAIVLVVKSGQREAGGAGRGPATCCLTTPGEHPAVGTVGVPLYEWVQVCTIQVRFSTAAPISFSSFSWSAAAQVAKANRC